jgi:hypothetical protein
MFGREANFSIATNIDWFDSEDQVVGVLSQPKDGVAIQAAVLELYSFPICDFMPLPRIYEAQLPAKR